MEKIHFTTGFATEKRKKKRRTLERENVIRICWYETKIRGYIGKQYEREKRF